MLSREAANRGRRAAQRAFGFCSVDGDRCGRTVRGGTGLRTLRRDGAARAGAEAAGAGDAVEAEAAPTSSMTAIGVPVATVSPSLTRSSRIVPVTGEGTPALTLSVETSTKSSYLFDGVADALEPLRDGSFGDRFAQLRHRDRSRHQNFTISRIVSAISAGDDMYSSSSGNA